MNSTRGNADYTIDEPRHYPFAFSDNAGAARGEQAAGQGQAGVPQGDVPQAAAPHGGVLLDLPQGAHPRRAQRLQGVPARAEPLRQLHPERRLGPRRAQLLLSAEGRGALRRLPHAARAPRATSARRPSTTAARSRSTTTCFPAANTGVPHLRGDAGHRAAQQAFLDKVVTRRHLRPARGRHDRRRASSARSRPEAPALTPGTALSRRDRRAHAQGRPPLHAGHGRLQRGLGAR